MLTIRAARPGDLEALYEISLKTGRYGEDASGLYQDGRMMGHIFSAPYLLFAPDLALVAEAEGTVMGFCVGVAETRRFEARLEADWWPALRRRYPKPDQDSAAAWTADQRRCWMIHEPRRAPDEVARRFPAHLHMNLLPPAQGQGVGARLFQAWTRLAREAGVAAAHVGVNALNARAVRFWTKRGFEPIEGAPPAPGSHTFWMGSRIA